MNEPKTPATSPAAHGSATRQYKEDHRPPRGGWADGYYMCRCCKCDDVFIGDKRAVICADCAYAVPCATEKEKEIGWSVNPELLDEITDAVNAHSDDIMHMEHTEGVILELAKRGYVAVAKSPND